MSVSVTPFGKNGEGRETKLYTVTNENGFKTAFTDSGAIWVSALVPLKEGPCDIILGCDDAGRYSLNTEHFGAPVGRVANRLTSPDGPCFNLNGRTYTLPVTDRTAGLEINLHSGPDFYERRIWKAEPQDDGLSVKFSLISPDGDQGYPGNLNVSVTYVLTGDNTVKIIYDAESDADTLFGMTNHAYFNLNGQGNGTVWHHRLMIDSDYYTEYVECLPTGSILPVEGTRFDYRSGREVGQELDDNWCVNKENGFEKPCVCCSGDLTGISLEVYTDMPGIQVYTSNFLNFPDGKGGKAYHKGAGICFESQYYVNAVNVDNPEFKKPVLKAHTSFHSETWYHFIWE